MTDKTKDDKQDKQAAQSSGGRGYHVSDLPDGAEPDPLGDASLTPEQRATAGTSGESGS